MFQNAITTIGGLGKSHTANLKAFYDTAPNIIDQDIKDYYQNILDSSENSDSGHTFSKVDMNYGGAPNLEDVEVGAGGKPGSPYGPNPASPGEGSMNPADIPEPIENYNGGKTSSPPFQGDGKASPNTTNIAVKAKSKLGDWGVGSNSGPNAN
jgi:hypothetical protein